MKHQCPSCNSEVVIGTSYCPNCRQQIAEIESKISTKQKFYTVFFSPFVSLSLALFVGIITSYSFYENNSKSLNAVLGEVLGTGLGFLIWILIPTLVITLVIFAIDKRFIKAGFSISIYVCTVAFSVYDFSIWQSAKSLMVNEADIQLKSRFDKNVFRNDYFNLMIIVPENWVVNENYLIDSIYNLGTDLLMSAKPELVRPNKNATTLLSINKYKIGSSLDFNPGFSISFERNKYKNITTSYDIALSFQNIAESINLYHLVSKPQRIEVNSNVFYLVNTEFIIKSFIVKQWHLFMLKGDYIIAITLTFDSSDDFNEIKSILKTLELA